MSAATNPRDYLKSTLRRLSALDEGNPLNLAEDGIGHCTMLIDDQVWAASTIRAMASAMDRQYSELIRLRGKVAAAPHAPWCDRTQCTCWKASA